VRVVTSQERRAGTESDGRGQCSGLVGTTATLVTAAVLAVAASVVRADTPTKFTSTRLEVPTRLRLTAGSARVRSAVVTAAR
jgi:hypothetical protein